MEICTPVANCFSVTFLGASPDNIFSCNCCGETAMDYKCPYSVGGMLISEVWDRVNIWKYMKESLS